MGIVGIIDIEFFLRLLGQIPTIVNIIEGLGGLALAGLLVLARRHAARMFNETQKTQFDTKVRLANEQLQESVNRLEKSHQDEILENQRRINVTDQYIVKLEQRLNDVTKRLDFIDGENRELRRLSLSKDFYISTLQRIIQELGGTFPPGKFDPDE